MVPASSGLPQVSSGGVDAGGAGRAGAQRYRTGPPQRPPSGTLIGDCGPYFRVVSPLWSVFGVGSGRSDTFSLRCTFKVCARTLSTCRAPSKCAATVEVSALYPASEKISRKFLKFTNNARPRNFGDGVATDFPSGAHTLEVLCRFKKLRRRFCVGGSTLKVCAGRHFFCSENEKCAGTVGNLARGLGI